MNSPYETELIVSSLTMSDLDELKPILIDDFIINATSGQIGGLTQEETITLMHERVETIDAKQEALNIDYSIDELIIAMDYWINSIHGRPIKGLGEVIAP